ncbi:702_t:CDS:1, partial [Dentiscutata heterogama]
YYEASIDELKEYIKNTNANLSPRIKSIIEDSSEESIEILNDILKIQTLNDALN